MPLSAQIFNPAYLFAAARRHALNIANEHGLVIEPTALRGVDVLVNDCREQVEKQVAAGQFNFKQWSEQVARMCDRVAADFEQRGVTQITDKSQVIDAVHAMWPAFPHE